jgi:hypothetical protein
MLHHIHKKIYHGREKGKSDLETLMALKKEGVSEELIQKAFAHHYPILRYQHKNNPPKSQQKVSPSAPSPKPHPLSSLKPQVLKPLQFEQKPIFMPSQGKTFAKKGVSLRPAVTEATIQGQKKQKRRRNKKRFATAACILMLLAVGWYQYGTRIRISVHLPGTPVQQVAGDATRSN